MILLLKAGPETTHTEHWQKRMDPEFGKMSGIKECIPEKRFDRDYVRLTVLSPEISGVTATAQFS